MMVFKSQLGETPIDDISELRIKGISTRAELNEFEARNVLKATIKYLAVKPNRQTAKFTLSWAKQLHQEMFGEVWGWAGIFRKGPVRFGDCEGLSWTQVETSLHNLLDNLRYWERSQVDLIEQAALLHHGAVVIHPFANGNGRWARMLANIWLKLHDSQVTRWPDQTIGRVSKIRTEYLDALKSADRGKNNTLIELHRRYTQ